MNGMTCVDAEGVVSAWPMVKAALEMLDPRDLVESLRSDVRTRFRGLVLVIAMIGMGRVRVVCGLRSAEEQQALWGRGRSRGECRKAGISGEYAQPDEGKATWIDPLESKHVAGMAIDVDLSAYEAESYCLLGHAARSVGVTWGGDWKVRDYGHFEV